MRRAVWISLCLAGCGRIGFGTEEKSAPPDSAPPGDARADASTARCDPSKPFARSDVPFTLMLNSDADEGGLTLTDDGLHAMFWSARNGRLQIFQTKRAAITDLFEPPSEVGELDSGLDDDTPSLSGDGKTVVFSSTRDLGGGGSGSATTDWNLWIARRASVDEPFGAPEPLADVNDINDNHGSFLVSASGAVYHSTNGDLFVVDGAVAPLAGRAAVISPLDNLNTGDSETAPVVSPDQRVIFFASNPGGGACDIWYSTRASATEPFPAAKRLEGGLNSVDDDDFPSWISADGCELYGSLRGENGMDLFAARRPL